MKRIVFFLFVLISCSKNEDINSTDSIVGNWELYAYRSYDNNNNYTLNYESPPNCCITFTDDGKLTSTESYDAGFIWNFTWEVVVGNSYNISMGELAGNTLYISNIKLHCNKNILVWDGESYGGYAYFQRQGYNYQDCNELEY